MKNENKGDEMVEIMSHLHQYVPALEYGKTVEVEGSGETVEVHQALVRRILFGGDQLTAARARGAKRARANSLSAVTRLEGIEPTAADFHIRLNLLDVSVVLTQHCLTSTCTLYLVGWFVQYVY